MQENLVIWGWDAGEFGDLGGEMQGNLVIRGMQRNLVIWGRDAGEFDDLEAGCRGIW